MLISIIKINYLISYQLCMTWLNWSLKFHSGLKTIAHLTLTHNTTSLWFNVCLSHLCDCTCSNVMCMLKYLMIKLKKIFECFICFWKWFYTFMLLVFFFSKYIVVFFFKNMFKGCFARSSRLKASSEKCLREINFFDNSHKNFCDCLATRLRLTASREMLFGLNWIFPNSDRSYCGCIATVSWLTASQ